MNQAARQLNWHASRTRTSPVMGWRRRLRGGATGQLFPRLPTAARSGLFRWFLLWLCVSGLPGVAHPAGQGTAVSRVLDPEWGVGAWIWDSRCEDKQTCRFWRALDIPDGAVVTRARLRITADNGYRLFLDGREVGRGSDWRSLTEYDLTWLLRPGRHVLAVEAFNDRLEAGVLAGLRMTFLDGGEVEVGTDTNWWVVPRDERGWERRRRPGPDWRPAVVVGAFGSAPWTTRPLAVVQVPALQPLTLPFWKRGWFQAGLLAVCLAAVGVSLRLMARLAWHRHAEDLLHRERMRIARDVHDELGAGLTQLVLLAEVTRREAETGGPVRESLQQLCSRARALAAALDEVVWAINSRRDTLQDFVNHTCKYAGAFLAQAGMRCRLDIAPNLPALSFALPTRRNLFLAVKEALNNAVKYSGAAEVHLSIRWTSEQVEVRIADEGRGFDPATVPADRNGLVNLRQRMQEVAGSCEVISAPSRGCTVVLRVPLQPSQARLRGFPGCRRRGQAAVAPEGPTRAGSVATVRNSVSSNPSGAT